MNAKVLVVDDSALSRRVVAQILAKAGFIVAGEAADGGEAVRQYQTLRPDLVTMDMVMPQMDGLQASQEIVRFDASARILLITSLAQDSLAGDAAKAGATEMLPKPFVAERLIELARRMLGGGTPHGEGSV